MAYSCWGPGKGALRRLISNMRMPAATEALSELKLPDMGMVIS